MQHPRRVQPGALLGLIALLIVSWTADLRANLSGNSLAEFTSYPLTADAGRSVDGQILIALAVDHQLWFEAYSDDDDIDRDGLLETSYDDTFQYYGYFHTRRCYRYVDSTARFVVAGPAGGSYAHYCSGALADAWSGNFLNWATMTRLDVLRKMLYGGRRSLDTADSTVLERASLPQDGHSFAKYYNGSDLALLTPFDTLKTDTGNGGNANGIDDSDEGITLCNTTRGTVTANSQTTTAPPLLRVAAANRQLWAANERWQCTWENENGDNANSNNPTLSGLFAGTSDPADSAALRTPSGSRDHVVRVEVCAANAFSPGDNQESCMAMPAGGLKPTGVLQDFGSLVRFGLLSGSYGRNLSGGVLRRNLGDIANEVDAHTGAFVNAPAGGGIIDTLERLRIYGYGYSEGTYLASAGAGENCSFQLATITEGRCASWGNPFAEIYAEALRYFASSNRAPTASFVSDDTSYIPGLRTAAWDVDPLLTNDGRCNTPLILGINSGVTSYDRDATGNSGFNAVTLTNQIGISEGLYDTPLFVGGQGSTQNRLCTAKTVDALGDVSGLCPGAATLAGSLHSAGLAWQAHSGDLRPDIEGSQKVDTVHLQLGQATTTLQVDLPDGRKVLITPEHRLLGVQRSGSLTELRVVRAPTAVNPAHIVDGRPSPPAGQVLPSAQPGSTLIHTRYYLAWDDSEQGADFDEDLWGTIDTVLDTAQAPARITVTTNVVAESTSGGQLFGFSIAGTTQDGFHAYSGLEGANFSDATGVPGCANCRALSDSGGQRGPQSHTFVVGESAARYPEAALAYAAKWGSFTDADEDGEPNQRKEWDILDGDGATTADLDNDGVPDGDGVPDAYLTGEPGQLARALREQLHRHTAAPLAIEVISAQVRNDSLLIQTSFTPRSSDQTSAGNKARWFGNAAALFVDSVETGAVLLREDTDQDGKLDGYDIDRVVEFVYDEVNRRWKFRRFASSSATEFVPADLYPVQSELYQLQPLWSARERLSDLHPASLDEQRDYATAAGSGPLAGRHILTWRDDNLDNVIGDDGTEIVAFTAENFSTAGRHRWLDESDPQLAGRLVNWTRGQEFTGLRSRVLDVDGNNAGGDALHPSGNPQVMRLGDSPHARPEVVAAPMARYDVDNGDNSYAAFRTRWQNRRSVVYIGANDGMLHAFNAGFFDAQSRHYLVTRDGETAHPLGAEIWAYVPKQLLPQLQWLAREDYTHVAYVDRGARAFDARVFTPDTDHPGGWGTVLVVGLGFGGGAAGTVLDIDDNGSTESALRSAYVVLDVTNPESPPRVLAELAPPGLAFATSVPVIFPVANGNGSLNRWYLAFGSGPTEALAASSTQAPQLYVYDIGALAQSTSIAVQPEVIFSLPMSHGFVGDLTDADYDRDMRTDALYFGTSGDAAGVQGALHRLAIAGLPASAQWGSPAPLLTNVSQPFVAAPRFARDSQQRPWVIAGSGRLLVPADTTSMATQTLYAVIDPNPATSTVTTPVDALGLVDLTQAVLRVNAQISSVTGTVDIDGNGAIDTTLDALALNIGTAGGWRRQLGEIGGSALRTSGAILSGTQLLQTAYTAGVPGCLLGELTQQGRLYAVDFSTGMPKPPWGLLDEEACPACPPQERALRSSINLGPGLLGAPPFEFVPEDLPPPPVITPSEQIPALSGAALALLGIALSWFGAKRLTRR